MYPFSVSHTESLLFDNTRSNSLKNRPLASICGTDCFLVKSQYVTFHVPHKTVGAPLFVMKVSYERLRGLRHVRCLCLVGGVPVHSSYLYARKRARYHP